MNDGMSAQHADQLAVKYIASKEDTDQKVFRIFDLFDSKVNKFEASKALHSTHP